MTTTPLRFTLDVLLAILYMATLFIITSVGALLCTLKAACGWVVSKVFSREGMVTLFAVGMLSLIVPFLI